MAIAPDPSLFINKNDPKWLKEMKKELLEMKRNLDKCKEFTVEDMFKIIG